MKIKHMGLVREIKLSFLLMYVFFYILILTGLIGLLWILMKLVRKRKEAFNTAPMGFWDLTDGTRLSFFGLWY